MIKCLMNITLKFKNCSFLDNFPEAEIGPDTEVMRSNTDKIRRMKIFTVALFSVSCLTSLTSGTFGQYIPQEIHDRNFLSSTGALVSDTIEVLELADELKERLNL